MDGDSHHRMMPPLHGGVGGGDVIPHVSGMPPAVASSMYSPTLMPPHHYHIHHHHMHPQQHNMSYPHAGMLHDGSPFIPELPPTPDGGRHEYRMGILHEHHYRKASRYDAAQVEITAESWRGTQELASKVAEDKAKAAAANGERGVKHSASAADGAGTESVVTTGKKRKNERCKSSVSSDAPPKAKKPRAPKGTRKPTKAALKAAAQQQASTPKSESRQESVHTPASSHAPTPTSLNLQQQQHLQSSAPPIASGGARIKDEFGSSTTAVLLPQQPQRQHFMPMNAEPLPPMTKLPPFHSQFQPNNNNLSGLPSIFGINSSSVTAAGIPASSMRQHSDGNSVAPGSNNSSSSSNTSSETFDEYLLRSITVSSDLFDGQGLTCEDITRTLNPAAGIDTVDAVPMNQNTAIQQQHQCGGAKTPFSRPSSSSAANQQQSFGSNNNNILPSLFPTTAVANNRNSERGGRAASTSSNCSAIINSTGNCQITAPDCATASGGPSAMVTAQDLDDCVNKLDPRLFNPQQPQHPSQNHQRLQHDVYGPPPDTGQQAGLSPPAALLMHNNSLQRRLFEQHSYLQMPNPNIPASHIPPPPASDSSTSPLHVSPGGCMPQQQRTAPPPTLPPNISSGLGGVPPQYANRMSVAQHQQHMAMLNESSYYPPPALRPALPQMQQILRSGMGPPPLNQPNPQQLHFQHQQQQQQRAAAAAAAAAASIGQQMYERTPPSQIPSSPYGSVNPKLGLPGGGPPPSYAEQLAIQQQQQQYREYSAREQHNIRQQHTMTQAPFPGGMPAVNNDASSALVPQSSPIQPGAKFEQQQAAAVAGGASNGGGPPLPVPDLLHSGSRQQQHLLQQQQNVASAAAARYAAYQPSSYNPTAPTSGHPPPPPSQYLPHEQHMLAKASSSTYGNSMPHHNLAYPPDHPANAFGPGRGANPVMAARTVQQQMSQLQQQHHPQQFQPNMMPKNPPQQQQQVPSQRPPPEHLNPAYMQFHQQYGGIPGRQPPVAAAGAPYGANAHQQAPPPYAAGMQHSAMPPNYQPQPSSNNSLYYGGTGPPPPSMGGNAGQMPPQFNSNR